MKPLVSILIPAYNAERWIHETISSALNQHYNHTEVILVNDGSQDNTLRIARSFKSKKLKIVDQENGGGPRARNTALFHAQGDYIQWLDHDDLLAPEKISEQVKTIQKLESDRILISGDFGTFYFNLNNAKFRQRPLLRNLTPLEYFQTKFEQDEWIHTTCWLVSRKLTELAGPWWDLRSPDDDGEYFCRVVSNAEKITYVSSAKSYWRIGNDSSFSNAHSKNALDALLQSISRSIEHFLKYEDSIRNRKACVTFLENKLINFYPEHTDIISKMNSLANKLGGSLSKPPLPSKYDFILNHLGWPIANRFSTVFPEWKNLALKNWDRATHILKS